ncbi:MAG: choice-of-anchor R domain-containing protein [Kiloniellaceae bacterium]
MTRANPLQAAFNAGEIGPRLAARVDFAKYRNAAARLENMIPLPQGGLTRRPGTRFVAAAAEHDRRPRLLPFEFSTEQAYVLEAGERRFRFFRNKGQIVVSPTDAAIANGAFDEDISGWNDLSSGGASIAHDLVDAGGVDTLKFAQIAQRQWGDNAGARNHIGLKWTADESGDVKAVTVAIPSHSSSIAAVASIWTDNAGSPGTQVGGDSGVVNIVSSGTYSFTWASKPEISQGGTYWVVLSDTGSGLVVISLCADQGDGFASGSADVIADITDVGPGGIPTASEDLRVKVLVETPSSNGVLALVGNGSDVAAAEQTVTTNNAGSEHVLCFRVFGLAGDKAILRVGNTTGGDQVLADMEVTAGWHCVAFTPDAGTFHVQFRNAANKIVHIDDVALIGSGAAVETPLELATPYAEADLVRLKWAQSADVMYVTQPDHPPMKLSRRGDTTWSLTEVAFFDGPYAEENGDSARTLKPTAVNGGTVTAAGHAPFGPGDIGRLLRIKHGSTWGAARIREVQSPESVVVEQLSGLDFGGTGASAAWRLGVWSSDLGYPSVVTFFEQRTAWANTRSQPQSFWMSQSGDLENMRPDSFEGGAVEVQDDDALDFTIAADQVNAIRWLSPGRQLILGTSGGEWSVTSDGPVVTPTDIEVKRESTNGSADALPLRIGSIVLFVQRARRKLREFVFSLETDGFRTPDLTVLADHVTEGGLREIVYQQEPDSQVHCLRDDGVLATLTYRREQDVVGWSRHILGGSFAGAAPKIESLATIPGNAAGGSENRDEAWVVVKRSIDGAIFRSIEVFEAPFEGPNPQAFDDEGAFDAEVLARQKRAFYVDSGLSYSGAATQTLGGLDHLEGETVALLADGALHPDRIVAGGQITLQTPASVVQVGLPYRHVFVSLKLEAGAAAGTAVGKVKRVHGIVLVLLHALGLKIGSSLAELEEVPLRDVADAMDSAVPLFTGERHVSFKGDFERDARIVIAGSAPLPFTLLAAAPELKTNEFV